MCKQECPTLPRLGRWNANELKHLKFSTKPKYYISTKSFVKKYLIGFGQGASFRVGR